MKPGLHSQAADQSASCYVDVIASLAFGDHGRAALGALDHRSSTLLRRIGIRKLDATAVHTDRRSALAADDRLKIAQCADCSFLSGCCSEIAGRTHFWAHRTCGKSTKIDRVGRSRADGALTGLAPIEIHCIDIGGHHQQVGFEVSCQQLAGKILVNHSFYAGIMSIRTLGDRDPPTPGADDDRRLLYEPLDRFAFDDAFGGG